jgi:serine/threonine protein kinase
MNAMKLNMNSFPSKLSEFGYIYLHPIGKGSFGATHLIYPEKYHQLFFLKQNSISFRFEIINEFELLKKLFHPHIINLYSMINMDFIDCIILEHCSGGTLDELVKLDGPIQPPKLYIYCHQILLAIDYLHQNRIAHRDLKPSNILLDKYERIKLIDFGLSQHVTSIIQNDFCGSKLSVPPEIWKHVQDYDLFSADIYSLGVLFYFLSQGKYPFSSRTEQILMKLVLNGDYDIVHTDPQFKEIIDEMMSKDPTKRPTSSQLLNKSLFQNIKASYSDLSARFNCHKKLPKLKSASIKYYHI